MVTWGKKSFIAFLHSKVSKLETLKNAFLCIFCVHVQPLTKPRSSGYIQFNSVCFFGAFKLTSIHIGFISVSFRFISVHFGFTSVSFRFISVHFGSFRFISVFSRTALHYRFERFFQVTTHKISTFFQIAFLQSLLRR